MDIDAVAELKERAAEQGEAIAEVLKAHDIAIHEMRHKVFTQKKALRKATKPQDGDGGESSEEMMDELDAFGDDDVSHESRHQRAARAVRADAPCGHPCTPCARRCVSGCASGRRGGDVPGGWLLRLRL